MSVDHVQRINGVVKAALKEVALGEPYGFAVTPPAIWPIIGPNGQVVGQGACWFVVVSIRDGLDPDISDGFVVPGFLPTDDDFRMVAQELFKKCKAQRGKNEEQRKEQAKAIASLEAQRQQATSGSGLAVAGKGQMK